MEYNNIKQLGVVMLIDKTYQHRNFVGNRLAEMIISGNFGVMGRKVYRDLPLYREMQKLSVVEFCKKYSLYTVDIERCVKHYGNQTKSSHEVMTAKEKTSIGMVSYFSVYSEFDLIAAFNYCVEHGCVFIKEYVSLNEYLKAIGQTSLNTWPEKLRKVKKGRVPGLKLDAIPDPEKKGDYKKRASYLYRLSDLEAISKHFKS